MSGRVIWITGLPGSGKTTLALELANYYGSIATVLDGDYVRSHLWPELDFTPMSRTANCVRTARIASMLKNQDSVVIVSLVSPLREMRAAARAIIGHMTEVCLWAPFGILKDRIAPRKLDIIPYEYITDDGMKFNTVEWRTEAIAYRVIKKVRA